MHTVDTNGCYCADVKYREIDSKITMVLQLHTIPYTQSSEYFIKKPFQAAGFWASLIDFQTLYSAVWIGCLYKRVSFLGCSGYIRSSCGTVQYNIHICTGLL